MFDKIPKGLNWNVTSWLVYDDTQPLPAPASVDEFNDFDDFRLIPYDKKPLLPGPDQVITLDVVMKPLGNGKP
jgi:iron transport multicopper oxidase